jgi:hypothetical protein
MDDHHFGYITKLKAKNNKTKKTPTHCASNSLSILCYTRCFPKQMFFCSCVKTLIWTCSLKTQVMWWTWFCWRLWGCSCSHPTHFSPLLQDDYTELVTQVSRYAAKWHGICMGLVTHPHPKATRVTSVETRVNFGCHTGIRNGTKPLLTFHPSGSLISQLINCSWALKRLFDPHNQSIVAELKCLANLTPHHWTRAPQSYYHESCCLPTLLYVTISFFFACSWLLVLFEPHNSCSSVSHNSEAWDSYPVK